MNIEAKQIATTILNQLGGRRFLVMTGVKNLVVLDVERPYGLRMTIPKNKTKANYLSIVLEDDDTYTMSFKYHNLNKKTFDLTTEVIEVEKMVYDDALAKFFTATTGLYTTL